MSFNLQDHGLFIVLSFILGNISGGLLNWIKLIQEIKKVFSKKNQDFKKYIINDEFWGHNTNPRFGFSFTEPLNWDRLDPDNGDGYQYVYPKNENIFFTISGSYNALEFDDLEGYINCTINNHEKIEILENRQSGRTLFDYPDRNTVVRENIKGWKLKYNYEIKGKKVTVLSISTLYNNTIFNIFCQAPKNKFEEFEDFFNIIITSFRILGENSAPFARNIR